MEIEEYIKDTRNLVDKALRETLGINRDPICRAIRYAVFSGGKRLRPILFLTALKDLGGQINEDTLQVASALEFIHIFSLIQDDLPMMDNDDYRRGKPTVHKVFGEDIALLASDALLNEAYRIVLGNEALSESTRVKILSVLIKAAQDLISGQRKDLGLLKKKVKITVLNKIYSEKTGALIGACLRTAGVICDKNSSQLDKLAKIGEKLGLAYQIGDDVLNVTCDEKAFKGRKFSDCKRGKTTYVTLRGITGAAKTAERLTKKVKSEIKTAVIGGERIFSLCDFIFKRKY